MNLNNYYDFDKLKSKKNEIKKIFFYRVCGTGMGAAACLLKEAGFEVAGADRMFYPPMSTYLENTGIDIFKLNEINLDKVKNEYDLIVVGNVVARDSADAKAIEELGIPFCSFPAAIGAFVLENKRVVGLSGTHGKTTTTYMGVQLFEKLGAKPGYLIGGIMNERPPASSGEGDIFFIESDEYDSAYFEKYSKFQSYSINNLVITSLEYDHADIFESIEDIKNEFSNLIEKVDCVIGCSDWKHIGELKAKHSDKDWYEYGNDTVTINSESSDGTNFSLKFEDKTYNFNTNTIGIHNILNLTSVITIALKDGYKEEQIQKAITNFRRVHRRQELKGSYKNSPVIDDFAHHPTAVRETLAAIKVRYPGKRINVYLEPGSATARSDIFQKNFSQALVGANKVVIIKPSSSTTAIGHGDLDIDSLIADIKGYDIPAVALTQLDALLEEMDKNCSADSVQLVMSNSSCLGLWSSSFAKKL